VNIIQEFRAYYSGSLETVTEAFVAEHFPHYLEMSYSERFTSPSFGEESIAEQTRRVRLGLAKMLPLATQNNVIVCSHFSVINIIGNIIANNHDLATYGEARFKVPEGGVITLQADPGALREALANSAE